MEDRKDRKDYKKLYWYMQHKYTKDLDSENSKYEDLLKKNNELLNKIEILNTELSKYKNKKYYGEIAKLSKNLDYGFIKEKEYGTIFFHVKNTNKISLKEDYITRYVEFNLIKTSKGYEAANVKII